MTLNARNASKRVTNEPVPNTQISSRTDIYEQVVVDEDAVKEDAQRMDALMRQMLGGDDEEEEDETEDTEEPQDMEDVKEENNEEEEEEEGYSFRLFASQPVTTVNIVDAEDNTDNWSKAVADQQVYEFDETDPEFVVRAKQAVIDFDTIVKQSTVPYPAMRLSHRITHILSPEEQAKKDANIKKTVKKRKSKKCRDFEKAVKEGKIELTPNMRNPTTPNGWPGWPGNLTRVAIIDYDGGKKKGAYNSAARGGYRGRGVSRGNSRGGSGGMMARGRGRGKSFNE